MPQSLSRQVYALYQRGYAPLAPSRALGPAEQGPFWRSLKNLESRDGYLRKRPSLTESLAAGSVEFFPQALVVSMTPTAEATDDAQTILGVWDLPGTTVDDAGGQGTRVVCTTRELFFWNAEQWYRATPEYNVGTVDVTNGSPTVNVNTGSPLWSQRGISAGQVFQTAGGKYRIASVTDTVITLAHNYEGATQTNIAYKIIRTFANENRLGKMFPFPRVFGQFFNGDFYLAGDLSANPWSASSGATWGKYDAWILKLPGINALAADTPATIVFGGSNEYVSGLDFIGNDVSIVGFEIYEDGRLVIPTHEPGNGSVIRWSSHLAGGDAVWNAIPAGFTSIVSHQGYLTGLIQSGPTFHAHFIDGVELGEPTGLLEAPFSWRPSLARYGTICPRGIQPLGGGSFVYPALDRQLRVFDGVADRPFAEISPDLRTLPLDHYEQCGFAAVDEHRGTYDLFIARYDEAEPPTFQPNPVFVSTDHFRIDLASLATSRHRYPVLLGSINRRGLSATGRMGSVTREKFAYIAGAGALNPLDAQMLLLTDETTSADFLDADLAGGHAAHPIEGVTDDLDLDLPELTKLVDHVSLWVATDLAAPEPEWLGLAISTDRGATWSGGVDPATKLPLAEVIVGYTPTAAEQILRFYFHGLSAAEALRLRLRAVDQYGNVVATLQAKIAPRLALAFQDLHPVEAVA